MHIWGIIDHSAFFFSVILRLPAGCYDQAGGARVWEIPPGRAGFPTPVGEGLGHNVGQGVTTTDPPLRIAQVCGRDTSKFFEGT
jgi:hypothetical protein